MRRTMALLVIGMAAVCAPPAMAQGPAAWEASRARAAALAAEGKHGEAVKVLGQVVTAAPTLAAAIYELGEAHAGLAGGLTPVGPVPGDRRRQLEFAETYYIRATELDQGYRDLALLRLTQVYDADALDQPDRRIRALQDVVAAHPQSVAFQGTLARALAARGRAEEAAKVLIDAQAKVEPDGQFLLAMTASDLVIGQPTLSRPATARLLAHALATADAAIARDATDRDAHQLRAGALLLQAERVAATPEERARLKAAGDEAFDRFYALGRGAEAVAAPAASPEDAALDQVQVMIDAGRAEEASKRLAEVLRQFAQSPMAWRRASGLRAQLGADPAQVFAAAERAAALDPGDPSAHLFVASVYFDRVRGAGDDARVAPAQKRAWVLAGLAAVERGLALKPEGMDEFSLLTYKGLLLRQQSALESDPKVARALTQQADEAQAAAKAARTRLQQP